MLANTPKPPYYAVIFTSVLNDPADGYDAMATEMLKLAEGQSGFLGFESARNSIGISVSYWQDEASINAWRDNSAHRIAQNKGQTDWYRSYRIRVARVERDSVW